MIALESVAGNGAYVRSATAVTATDTLERHEDGDDDDDDGDSLLYRMPVS